MGKRVPCGTVQNKRQPRDTLTLAEGVQFLTHLRGRPQGWNILCGVALQILCGLRPQEVRLMRWSSVDLVAGTITVEENPKSGFQSHRTLPVCGLVRDILVEGRARLPGEFLMVPRTKDTYRQAFNRARDGFRKGAKHTPYSLRRTLVSEFFRRRWYQDALQVYRGHKPKGVSAVDWEHYIEFDPEGLLDLLREHIIRPLDGLLEDPRREWQGQDRKVINLF